MKNIKNILLFSFALLFVGACEEDTYDISAVDAITAPSNVSAIFDITQDNTGLVTIVPQAENVAKFRIKFGDMSDEVATEYALNELISHIYEEGVYTLDITAVGITGLTTTINEELNITFKAPENLIVSIAQDAINPKIVTVSANADFATVMEIYFGDQDPELPTLALPGEAVQHTYANPGEYSFRVVAKSAGAATAEYTETIIVPDATDPVAFPIDFESFTVNYAFSDFGNAASTVIDNPDATGINTSNKVGQLIKSAGAEVWAGSLLTLGDAIDFSSKKLFYMKVWSPKSGAIVKLKVENLDDGGIAHEVDVTTTTSNAWEELAFDFSDVDDSQTYQKVVVFFDFGNPGDDALYYFDDIRQGVVPTGVPLIVGTWKMAPEAGAFGVGPELGDISWFANSADDVTLRDCFFDDTYVFGIDGSFKNELGGSTWVEGWQGGGEACETPVAPHDGSVPATYTYDQAAGQVTLEGMGSFLGIPKAINGGELASPGDAPASVTYDIAFMEDDTVMIVDINIGGGWWRFKMVKAGSVAPTPLTGTWQMAPEAGAFGVGPDLGDISWFANSLDDVTLRNCFFDDTYVFGLDGSFQNVLGAATWVEGWQGGGDACEAPVAPHDGSIPATYTYDEITNTVRLDGQGAFLGIPKAFNGGELANPGDAPASITYDITLMDGNTVMIADISIGGGWWRFKLIKN
jgi:hypothetical protein